MYKLEYAPRAMDDMARVKEYITLQHGANVARKSLRRITSSARRLEKFPEEGPGLEALVRVLNEQQDFLQMLFGITTVTDEPE